MFKVVRAGRTDRFVNGCDIEKVNGSVRAINIAPVSPGMAPTITPDAVPIIINTNGNGVKT